MMHKWIPHAALAAIAAALLASPAQAQSDDWRKPVAQRNCTLNGVCPKITHSPKRHVSAQAKAVAGGVHP